MYLGVNDNVRCRFNVQERVLKKKLLKKFTRNIADFRKKKNLNLLKISTYEFYRKFRPSKRLLKLKLCVIHICTNKHAPTPTDAVKSQRCVLLIVERTLFFRMNFEFAFLTGHSAACHSHAPDSIKPACRSCWSGLPTKARAMRSVTIHNCEFECFARQSNSIDRLYRKRRVRRVQPGN